MSGKRSTRYFVSYSHASGFGNCHITVQDGPWGEDTKESVHDWLKSTGLEQPVILFFHEIH